MKKQPTSREVAQTAGVSRTTVSFVLNNERHGISDKTRQKVLAAAEKLGYEPNAAAKSLVAGGSKTIALVIPKSSHLHVDAFLPRFLSAANDYCHAHGYKVLLESSEDAKRPDGFAHLLKSRRVDGLIMVNMRQREYPLVKSLFEQGFAVIAQGSGEDEFYSHIPHKPLAGNQGAKVATRHLIAQGHTRIAHVGFAPKTFGASFSRQLGYLEALEEAGIAPDPKRITYADISAESGFWATQKLLAQKTGFTALFAGNDTVALGAMRALTEARLSIPADVAVVGYDDIPLAPFASPPLTTIRTDPLAQGVLCVAQLFSTMRGEAYEREVLANDTLIVRASCGAKK